MNIKELKEIIKDLPDEMQIYLDQWSVDDSFRFNFVQEAKVEEIPFYLDEDDVDPATEKVLVIECL